MICFHRSSMFGGRSPTGTGAEGVQASQSWWPWLAAAGLGAVIYIAREDS